MRTIPLRMARLLLVALASLTVVASCSSQEGTTPTCTEDMDANGNKRIEGGCNPLPACVNLAGQQVDPRECCMDKDMKPFTGTRLQECLYGYAGTVSSSATGTGGGGGAGGGGGGAGGAGGSN